MRIAVASEGLEVAPRFRQCASYMCYRVERGIIVECQNLPNPGLAAPKLVALLVEMGVDTLIVGAIDYDVANVFCHAGVEVIAGAHGSAREVVQVYITRTLTGRAVPSGWLGARGWPRPGSRRSVRRPLPPRGPQATA